MKKLTLLTALFIAMQSIAINVKNKPNAGADLQSVPMLHSPCSNHLTSVDWNTKKH